MDMPVWLAALACLASVALTALTVSLSSAAGWDEAYREGRADGRREALIEFLVQTSSGRQEDAQVGERQ